LSGCVGPFQSLRIARHSLHEEIADSIQETIAENHLPSGTRLPTERDLAQTLRVSRPTVREALRLLHQRGLVKMKVGSGTFVATVSASSVAESIERYLVFGDCSYEELLTARETLEPDMASLAARRATPDDLVRLRALVEQVEIAAASNDIETFARFDASFHETLAEATHNQLIIAVVASLEKVMRAWIRTVSESVVEEEGARSHRPVYDAIAAGDPARAREAMQVHMRTARMDLLGDKARTKLDC
jgi:GntR family transcriptional repressor for pyruvate dehydrogenase complex